MSRYRNRELVFNDDKLYQKHLKKRNRDFINHFETPTFFYPDFSEQMELEIFQQVWSHGDRFYKLAHEHYGDASLWWVIAWFNQTPTEAHLEIGDVIDIPSPLESILQYYGVY